MTKSRGIRKVANRPWTELEDYTLLRNVDELGHAGLAASGLLPGRSKEGIHGRHKFLRGIRNPERDTFKTLRIDRTFDKRHPSVWGYAAYIERLS